MGFLRWIAGYFRELWVVFLALKDRRVSIRVKVLSSFLILFVIVYALNPFDIFPDFFLAGWIDDLIIFPLVFYIVERLLPRPVLLDYRRQVNPKADRISGTVRLVTFAVIGMVLAFMGLVIFLIVLIIRHFTG